jgi:NAD(P)-dependent dehydrogenase (short-subunit alcohol dehydrogenase family)
MGQLDGKVALITGAASGMGEATTELFVKEGAHVLAVDIQDEKGVALERRFNGQVKYKRCDVMSENDIRDACNAAAEAFGGLDILFNNAGAGGSMNTIENMTGEAWDYSQNLLLRSVALGITYALPHMKARGGGSIVNVASVAGISAGLGPIAYSVAKAGVMHLTKTAAAELARDNIRINAICPGLILTNIFTPASIVPEAMAEQIKAGMRANAPNAQPVPKAGEALDIAKACLFLASDQSAFITGVSLPVDGGMTIGPREAWEPEGRARRGPIIQNATPDGKAGPV